jgi:hypothetical protein
MPDMDIRNLQPTIDALNAEIQRLTSARDTLQALSGSGPGAAKKKKPTLSPEGRKRLADNMRKRWAEQKRQQRAAKGTK